MDLRPINYDIDPSKVEVGTTLYNNNVVFLDSIKSIVNERGIQSIYDAIEDDLTQANFKIIGYVILPENKIVLFTKDLLNNLFNIKCFDINIKTNFNIIETAWEDVENYFNPNYGIQGDYTFNSLTGNYDVVFTNTISPPRVFEIVENGNKNWNQTYLFQDFEIPVVNILKVNNLGGVLQSGSYSFICRYRNRNGFVTNWYTNHEVVNIYQDILNNNKFIDGNAQGINTAKSIKFNVIIDPNFDFIEIGFIQRLNNQITAYSFLNQSINKTADEISIIKTYILTGNEAKTAVPLENILSTPPNPSKVFSLTFANSNLLLGGLTYPQNINYQRYANNIKVWAVAKRVELDSTSTGNTGATNYINGNSTTTFKANEVKAFYIALVFKDGSKSSAYHIPGVVIGEPIQYKIYGTIGNPLAVDNALYEGLEVHKLNYYEPVVTPIEVEEVDYVKRTGPFFNTTEFYPNTDDFDVWNVEEGVGIKTNKTLRNKRVGHHYLPGVNDLGGIEGTDNKVPVIGIVLSDVKFPTEVVNVIKGYEIYYTKAESNNTVVNGQDLLLYGTVSSLNNKNITTNFLNTDITNGGSDKKEISKNHLRLHSPDLLYGKPSVNPSAIRFNNRFALKGFSNPAGQAKPFNTNPSLINTTGFTWYKEYKKGLIVDYLNCFKTIVPATGLTLHKIENHAYIPNHAVANNVLRNNFILDNLGGEEYFHCETDRDFYIPEFANGGRVSFNSTRDVVGDQVFGNNIPDGGDNDNYFYSALIDICTFYENLFVSFEQQKLVQASSCLTSETTPVLWSGDAEWALHNVITTSKRFNADTDDAQRGLVVAYRIPIQTYLPISLRYINSTDVQSTFYPNASIGDFEDLVGEAADYKTQGFPANLDITKKPIMLLNTDFGFVQTTTGVLPAGSNNVYRTEFPNLIISSNASSEESGVNTWRRFDGTITYTTESKFGRITKLTFDGINVLIHCENILYRTRGNQNLTTNEGIVNVGATSVFDLPPQPVLTTALGYAGLQQRFAAIYCPLGYCFYDSSSNDLFILSSELTRINAKGFLRYFKQFANNNKYNYLYDNVYNLSEDSYKVVLGYDKEFNRLLITFKLKTINGEKLEETISYSPDFNGFTSLHDYKVDNYITGRNKLYSIINNNICEHNINEFGLYYLNDGIEIPYKSLVTAVVGNDVKKQIIFNNVTLVVTQYRDGFEYIELENKISLGVFSGRHYSGLIETEGLSRTVKNILYFNNARNLLKTINTPFKSEFFKLKPDAQSINTLKPWYDRNLISGNFIAVIVEINNESNEMIVIKDLAIGASISDR